MSASSRGGKMETKTITKRMPITLFSCIALVRDAYLNDNLELPLTPASLRHLGMKEWHIHPTKRSLADLHWFSEGYPTEAFVRMAEAFRANHDEYQSILKTLLKEGIYAEPTARIVDAHIDLAKASASQIEGFFKGYDPPNGYKDMAYLYLSFCREAGLAPPLENRPHLTNETKVSNQKINQLDMLNEQEGNRMNGVSHGNTHGFTDVQQTAKIPRIERQRRNVMELLEDMPEEGQDPEWWIDALKSDVELLIKLFSRKDDSMKP
jgi:hypothetical protein